MRSLYRLKDNKKRKIHAHGGGFMKYGEYYYWYGEDRQNDNYVSIYRSRDLCTWEFCNHILTIKSKQEAINGYQLGLVNDNGGKVNIERPKIFYSEEIKKFVLWAHYENGINYDVASCCVATCDKIDGDYIFHGYFRPFGYMSRDCTIFIDGDKKYFISSSNDNADLHIYEMSSDGLSLVSLMSRQFIGKYREAPALFKKDGLFYILTSACTGWYPNQCQYAFTDDLSKGFSQLINIDNDTTSHSQPMCVFNFGNSFVYIGDRWGGLSWKNNEEFDYFKSTYTYTGIIINDKHLKFKDLPWNELKQK